MLKGVCDMMSAIKNAQMTRKEIVSFPFSKIKWEISKLLEKQGFIEKAKKKGKEKKRIVLHLKYINGEGAIFGIKMISKPGRRIYLKHKELYLPKRGYGILILSTPNGIMTSKEAKKIGQGGEAICEVW